MDAAIRQQPDVTEAIEPDQAEGDRQEAISGAARMPSPADARAADQDRHAVVVADGDYAIEVAGGDLSATADLGRITIQAMQAITLKVGESSITIDQSGVTIRGLVIDVEGVLQTGVKGLTTQVKGAGLLQLGGGLTKIG